MEKSKFEPATVVISSSATSKTALTGIAFGLVVSTVISVSVLESVHNMNIGYAASPLYSCVDMANHESDSSYIIIESGGVRMPIEYYRNNTTLDQIASLKDNWNDNGATAFSEYIIQRSRDLIKKLDRQPLIFPTANDSIQFEYEKENGDYLEFELFEDGQCKMFYSYTGRTQGRRFINLVEMNEEVNKFYGQ